MPKKGYKQTEKHREESSLVHTGGLPRVILNCLFCKKKITVSPSYAKKTKFCSRKCYLKIHNENYYSEVVKQKAKEFLKKPPDKSGYVLGVLIGDGNSTKYSITLGCKDKDFAQAFYDAIKEIVPLKPTLHFRSNLYWVKAYSKSWVFIFEYQERHLKLFTDNLSIAGKREFLKGFFDAEGSIYFYKKYPSVSFYNTNIKYINIIKSLLNQLNYHPKQTVYFPRKNNYEKKKQYSLRLFRKGEVSKFGEEIGSSIRRKQKRFKEVINV